MSQDLHRPAYMTRLGNVPAKSILALIADQVNVEGLGWPSVDYIVRMTETERRTVLRVLEVFAAIDLVRPAEVMRGTKRVAALQINLAKLGTDLTEEYLGEYARTQGKMLERAPNGKLRMKARGRCVSETQAESVSETGVHVSETRASVSETRECVSETFPPDPLNGGPPNDPLGPASDPRAREAGEFDAEQQEHLDRLAAEVREGEPEAMKRLVQFEEYYRERNREALAEFAAAEERAAKEIALRAEYPDLETALKRVRKRCGFAWSEGDELGPVLRQVFMDQEEMGKPVWRTASQMVAAWELQRSQGEKLRARYGPMKFFRDGHWLDSKGWHWNTR